MASATLFPFKIRKENEREPEQQLPGKIGRDGTKKLNLMVSTSAAKVATIPSVLLLRSGSMENNNISASYCWDRVGEHGRAIPINSFFRKKSEQGKHTFVLLLTFFQ